MNLINKFSSLSLQMKIIIIVIIFLIILWFANVEYPKLKLYFQPRSLTLQPGESATISDTRKKYLENLANLLYNDLYSKNNIVGAILTLGGGYGHDSKLYTEATVLTDNELLYLSNYYKQYLTQGTTLYTDVNNDYFTGDENIGLMEHLSKIGER